ncbi:MAG TPA: hypothetical protein VKD47_08810 [Miltoncostaeaceae bacterium]|nr:hypothetical protein [Miltoncostaeaceae bacterium]
MAGALVIRDPDLAFRSLAAPGLDEDDIFAAMHGLPGAPLWGEGRPPAMPEDEAWSEEAERRRRHERLLARWPPERAAAPGRQPRAAM